MELCGILSVLSLIIRFIHSRGIERAQIKWFTFAAAFTVICIMVIETLNFRHLEILLLPVVLAIPAAAGIAILRYHLFDIDLIIRRTLLYAIVSGLLAAVYFGSVLLLQQIFHSLTGESNPVAIVISTLIISVLFNPLRGRVQQALDRRFYRQRYDAENALAAFSSDLRSEVDFHQVSQRLLDTVQETVQPDHVVLWVRKT
jgi:K+-sensing histidine kinase KdpD